MRKRSLNPLSFIKHLPLAGCTRASSRGARAAGSAARMELGPKARAPVFA
jgi:hypothetical protein